MLAEGIYMKWWHFFLPSRQITQLSITNKSVNKLTDDATRHVSLKLSNSGPSLRKEHLPTPHMEDTLRVCFAELVRINLSNTSSSLFYSKGYKKKV